MKRASRVSLPWLIGIAGLSFTVLLIWRVPQWQIPAGVSDPTTRAELENASRGNVLGAIQTLGGLGFIATAYLAWRNYQISEDKQVSERFGKAIEMLADKRLQVRLGGIYLLERIARDSKNDHPVVMEVLTAFVRDNSPCDLVAPITSDIQAVLTVLGRRNTDSDRAVSGRLNLSKTNLMEAYLAGANFARADFEDSVLVKANLVGANFRAANLEGVNFGGSFAGSADFSYAFLTKANLKSVNFAGANFTKARILNVRWDSSTDWTLAEGLDTVKEMPARLRKDIEFQQVAVAQQMQQVRLILKDKDGKPMSS